MRISEAAPVLLIMLITLLHFHGTMCLSTNFYQKSCPDFDKIMEETTTNKQITSPTTAAGTLRLFFHDCFHSSGCDASILLSSTPFNKSERSADINLSLPGDAFDLLTRAKTALELRCPYTVSCSDILAVSARNLLVMSGGPHYPVLLGRRDGTSSSASSVKNKLPLPSMSVTNLIQLFASAGFSVQEMVALTGAHTLGFSHCKEFSSDIYNYSSHDGSDPSYNPRFAAGLRNACAGYKKNPTLSVFNDIMSPNKFDNMYYKNLQKGLGLLASDRALVSDWRTREYVESYAKDEKVFFGEFSKAMQKLSVRGVKTGSAGEIRRRCDAVN